MPTLRPPARECNGNDRDSPPCGAEDTPVSALAAAISSAKESESYRTTFEVESDLGGEDVAISGNQITNADATRLRVDDAKYSEDGEQIDMDMILIDGEAWMRSPQLRGVVPKDKPWVHMTDDEFTQQSLTPTQLVELLQDDPDMKEVGQEQIRGVQTVHLRGPLDLHEAIKRVDGPVTDRLKNSPMLDRMEALMDVWIEEEKERLVRVAMKITADGEPGDMRFSGDLLEKDVSLASVEPPPKDQVSPESVLDP